MKSSLVWKKSYLLALLLLCLPWQLAWSFDLPAETSGNGFLFKESEDESGHLLRGIGDINGDGIDDFAMANPFWDRPGLGDNDDSGRVYVIFGSQTSDPIPVLAGNLEIWINQNHGFIVTGASGSRLGSAVAGGCDINNDLYQDLIISAPTTPIVRDGSNGPANSSEAGKVYVINGHSNGLAFNRYIDIDNTATPPRDYWNAEILGEDSRDRLGTSLSCAKDLNGDSYDDIVIGSGRSTATIAFNDRRGRAYVVFGSALFSTDASNAQNRLQIDLRDQTGATPVNPSQGITIEAAQFSETIATDPAPLTRIMPDSFSASVASLGDVNGDGVNDIAIGAPDASPNGTDTLDGLAKAGQVYVLFGGASLSNFAIDDLLQGNANGVIINGIAPDFRLGHDVRWGGNINGDTINGNDVNDIVLGSPIAEINGLAYQGRAYVIFGASGLSGEVKLADLEQPGAGGAAQSGFVIDGVGGSSAYRVMGLGDVNGDGVDDLGISSHTIQSSNRGGGGGGAFVVFGRGPASPFPAFPATFSLAALAEIDNPFGFVIYGDQAGENAGEEMAALGNINADNYADFALSAINHASSKIAVTNGKIYGIYGAANIQSVEVREAHHEGATINRTPTPDNTKPQHNVGHAFALLIILTLGFFYRLFATRRLATSRDNKGQSLTR